MKYLILVFSLMLLVSCASKNKEQRDVGSIEQSSSNQEVKDKLADEDNQELEVIDIDEFEEETVGDIGASALGEYTIEKGDTFMWIAYKLFGDFKRWRELEERNPEAQIVNLKVGAILFYDKPEVEFNWREPGISYTIQNGDSLSKISRKVYGTTSFWRKIWENNSRMISNPNLIFADFILFYKSKSALALK